MGVAAAPMLLAIASAIRNGTGLRRRRSNALPMMGAKTKQTTVSYTHLTAAPVTVLKNRTGVTAFPRTACLVHRS